MIIYKTGGLQYITKLFRCTGSVFPSVLLIAVPNGALAALLRWGMDEDSVGSLVGEDNVILSNNSMWSTFSFLVGFLVVFRTSQAYARFFDGCTYTYRMKAEWYEACSSIIAFCAHSKQKEDSVLDFQYMCVRLFSMMHACALAEIEDCNHEQDMKDCKAFRYELVDAAGIGTDCLLSVQKTERRTELVMQWIQQMIVANIETGIMSIPPPLLSRVFQELSNGMVAFNDALRLSSIPFPFPYAQTADILLILHWILVPVASAQWTTTYLWAGVFSSMQVLVLWTLNFIATEIENPFGEDANDIDLCRLQVDMNRSLTLLVGVEAARVPKPHEELVVVQRLSMKAGPSLMQVWNELCAEKPTLQTGGSNHVGSDLENSVDSLFPTDQTGGSTPRTWLFAEAPHRSLPKRIFSSDEISRSLSSATVIPLSREVSRTNGALGIDLKTPEKPKEFSELSAVWESLHSSFAQQSQAKPQAVRVGQTRLIEEQFSTKKQDATQPAREERFQPHSKCQASQSFSLLPTGTSSFCKSRYIKI